MLINFSVENFKSFASRATLSMLAHKADKTLSGALLKPAGLGDAAARLLPVAAIYGPNAGGKTNVILAIKYLKDAVAASQAAWRPGAGTQLEPHALKSGSPSEFEIELLVSGIRYRYGFRALPAYFSEEWLYSYPKNRERMLFYRETRRVESDYLTKVEYGASLTGGHKHHEATRVRTRENSLFLSSAAQDNQREARAIYDWLSDEFEVSLFGQESDLPDGDRAAVTSRMCSDIDVFKTLTLGLLRAADPNILDIEISCTSDDVPSLLETKVNREDRADLERFVEDSRNFNVRFVIGSPSNPFRLPLEVQSRGVQRLYLLASSILTALKFGEVLIVDELDTSVHPNMAAQVIALFQSNLTNSNGAQLLFSTHETRLLSLQHLRRDQVWFVEKEEGESRLYSLLDFRPRKDENFENGYLRGRYGAIPPAAFPPEWVAVLRGDD